MLKNIMIALTAALLTFSALGALLQIDPGRLFATVPSPVPNEEKPRVALEEAKLNDLRLIVAEQGVRLSENSRLIERFSRDMYKRSVVIAEAQQKVSGLAIGLNFPPLERELQTVAYFRAWHLAVVLEDEVKSLKSLYASLEQTMATRVQEAKLSADREIVAKYDAALQRLGALESEMDVTVSRFEQKVAERESTIIGLVHRLSSKQQLAETEVESLSAITQEQRSAASKVSNKIRQAPAHVTIAHKPSAIESTVSDGVDAYQAGDYRRAFLIWRPLADHGNARALYYLGALYFEGRGVKQDFEMAYRLLDEAHQKGHSRAQELRDSVAVAITENKIAEVYSPKGS